MTNPFDSGSQLAAAFSANGFVVLPSLLNPEHLAALDAAIDRDLAAFPEEWVELSPTLRQTVDILPRTEAFDSLIEHPGILLLLRQILGPRLTFEEFSIILRDPVKPAEAGPGDIKGWHRDIVRAFDRRFEIEAVSAVCYLTEVTAADHCFSIIPGTHGPRSGMRPEDVKPGMEVDVLAPAGSAILFHARCLHAGRIKPTTRQRRTLHLYYSTADRPRTSEWSSIPERLYRRPPAAFPDLYAKWNRSDVIDGTGRKPADLDRALPAAALLREVQRRANRATQA